MVEKIGTLNNKSLISVIIPLYNAERYIKSTLDSVLNQTYQNFEVIIIDDTSTDSGPQIVKQHANEDNRIKYYRNEKNSGVSVSRNRGVKLALGDWVAFIDSDDKWEKDKLEKQINCVNENQCEFVFTGSSFVDENDEFYPGTYSVPQKITYAELLKSNYISCSSVLIKKKYLLNCKFGRDDIHEDYACWLQILRDKKISAYGIQEPLLVYRISKNSKSGNKVKSAKMVYGVYRYIGFNILQATYYWSRFFVNRNKKYKAIHSKG